ncbi:MAG: hypothetical protein U0228_37475 [Myxococcaceae bacterium]
MKRLKRIALFVVPALVAWGGFALLFGLLPDAFALWTAIGAVGLAGTLAVVTERSPAP